MQLKKMISGVVATAMLTTSLLTGVQPALAWEAPGEPQTTWREASRDGVKARFFVGSDLHIGSGDDAAKKLSNALASFYSVDSNANGVLFVGDLTNGGENEQYDELVPIINNSDFGKAGKVQMVMGNHDFYNKWGNPINRFKDKTSQSEDQAIYYDNAGNASASPGDTLAATVLKISPKYDIFSGDMNDYTADYDWVKSALETATAKNPSAPVIVMGHHGIQNTAYVTDEWYGNYGSLVDLFKQYPQVIHISGHSHSTMEDARSIYQNDGYTAIQDGTIGAYFENETGKIDPDSGADATIPPDSPVASQALRIDVLDDNTVKIYRMNLTSGQYMYEEEPWTFNRGGDLSDRPYDENRTSDAPTFEDGATVTATKLGAADIMKVEFPAATPASGKNNDMVHEYQITLTPQGGGESITRSIFADYYMTTPKKTWSVNIHGVNNTTTYDVSVVAQTSFGAQSAPLTGSEQHIAPTPDILNIDYRNGSTEDANGHALTVFGTPEQRTDVQYGTVYHFDGSDDGMRYTMMADDYNKFKNNYTMEALVKLAGTPGDPFSGMESAGCGFELNDNGSDMEFWNHVGDYKSTSTNISALHNTWVHLVATFDGSETKLYVNGELKSTASGGGAMTVPDAAAQYFFVGGDTDNTGALQRPSNCDVALARIYTGSMTAKEVAQTYLDLTHNTGDEDPSQGEANILDINFANSTADDQSSNAVQAVAKGQPVIHDDSEMIHTADFDGNSSYIYPLDGADYGLMDKVTIETTFKANTIPADGENDIFSNQESGGIGIGVEDGQLVFYCNVNGDYYIPKATIPAGEWVHVAGTYDGQMAKLYVNGQLVDEVEAIGAIQWPASNSHYFAIGADSHTDGNIQNGADAEVSSARLYSAALDAKQIAALYEKEEPALMTVSDDATTMKTYAQYDLPNVTASDHHDVTISDIQANGESVMASEYDPQRGKLTPMHLGTYTFTFVHNCDFGQQIKTVTRTSEQGEAPNYTVSVDDSENGTVSVDKKNAKEGETVSITPTPSEGYEVEKVTVSKANGSVDVTDNKNGTYSFTQPAEDVTVTVTFVKASYTVTITEPQNGTVSVDKETAKEGEIVTITPTPSEGFEVDTVIVSKAEVEVDVTDNKNGTYSFTQPAEDVTVTVTFTKEDSSSSNGGGGISVPHYKPEIAATENGTISVNPSAPAAGQTVTITTTPDDGYTVDSVTVTDKNGDDVATTKNSDGTFSFEQPHGKVSITVTFAKAGSEWNNPFSDVNEDDWFFDPVRYVQQNGLMVGTSDDAFSPNLSTSRGMLVTILWRLAGEPAADQSANFSDVTADSWYADAVAWASGEGIVGGYGDGRFGANDAITREQMASMFQRYADFCGIDTTARGDLSAFSDGDTVSSWANEPMAWAVADGLLGGFEDNSLRPQGQATRAQVAAILQRFCEQHMA